MANKKASGPKVKFLQIGCSGCVFMIVVKHWYSGLKEYDVKITAMDYDEEKAYVHNNWANVIISYNPKYKDLDNKNHVTVETQQQAKEKVAKYVYDYIYNTSSMYMSYNDAKKIFNLLK